MEIYTYVEIHMDSIDSGMVLLILLIGVCMFIICLLAYQFVRYQKFVYLAKWVELQPPTRTKK